MHLVFFLYRGFYLRGLSNITCTNVAVRRFSEQSAFHEHAGKWLCYWYCFLRNQVEIKNIDKINYFTYICRMNKNQVILVFHKDRQIDFFFQSRHLIINML